MDDGKNIEPMFAGVAAAGVETDSPYDIPRGSRYFGFAGWISAKFR